MQNDGRGLGGVARRGLRRQVRREAAPQQHVDGVEEGRDQDEPDPDASPRQRPRGEGAAREGHQGRQQLAHREAVEAQHARENGDDDRIGVDEHGGRRGRDRLEGLEVEEGIHHEYDADSPEAQPVAPREALGLRRGEEGEDEGGDGEAPGEQERGRHPGCVGDLAEDRHGPVGERAQEHEKEPLRLLVARGHGRRSILPGNTWSLFRGSSPPGVGGILGVLPRPARSRTKEIS